MDEATLHVGPPTGRAVDDHAVVQAAFDAVEPGGTVLFGHGTYVLGRSARLTVPDVTIQGHPKGTVLRGGAPEAFDVERFEDVRRLLLESTGLEVRAPRQTIRSLTFEYAWHGIFIGSLPDTLDVLEGGIFPSDPVVGGHRIEGNTFRVCPNGIRAASDAPDATVIRDNDFVDTYHAIVISAGTVHFLQNRIVVEDPGRVPMSGHPGGPLIVAPDAADESGPHVIAENLIEGHPEGIEVHAWGGKRCAGLEIRDNTIRVSRVEVPRPWMGVTTTTSENSTVGGVPIRLIADPAANGGAPGVVEDVLVQGNRVLGAEGVGIELRRTSRCEVVENMVRAIRRRIPFPGNTLDDEPEPWEVANGSAIWISAGSEGNLVARNSILDLDGESVVVEGDGNRIEISSEDESVRDLGRANTLESPAEEEDDR